MPPKNTSPLPNCAQCGKPLQRHSRKYCSRACNSVAQRARVMRACAACGAQYSLCRGRAILPTARFCSTRCKAIALRGANAPTWKGGTTRDGKDGYRLVNVGPNTQRLEHRVIMERHLGRALTRDEVVHHINEDKGDNRIENLAVMTRSEHMRMHRRQRRGVSPSLRA